MWLAGRIYHNGSPELGLARLAVKLLVDCLAFYIAAAVGVDGTSSDVPNGVLQLMSARCADVVLLDNASSTVFPQSPRPSDRTS